MKFCEEPHKGMSDREKVGRLNFNSFFRWFKAVQYRQDHFLSRMSKPIKKENVGPFFFIQHISAVLYAEFQITTLIRVKYRV